MTFKRLVLVDLDGVLNIYNGRYNENEIPKIKTGADKFLQRIIEKLNCDIKIFTTRPKELTQKWIKHNSLELKNLLI